MGLHFSQDIPCVDCSRRTRRRKANVQPKATHKKVRYCPSGRYFALLPRCCSKSGTFWWISVHSPSTNANGWDASITGNFKHILGITGDFSGAYERGVHAYTYTGGPVLTARLPVVQPFVHALFGGMTVGGGTSSSTSGFTMMFGGGLDIGMRKGIGFRVVQADWISTNFSGTTRNRNVRASTGLVIKF